MRTVRHHKSLVKSKGRLKLEKKILQDNLSEAEFRIISGSGAPTYRFDSTTQKWSDIQYEKGK